MKKIITVSNEKEWASAEFPDHIIYVCYGSVLDGINSKYCTTERIGHFLDSGEKYPTTEEELKLILERLIN